MEKQRVNGISRRERKKLLLSQLKDLSSEIITDSEKLEWFADKVEINQREAQASLF